MEPGGEKREGGRGGGRGRGEGKGGGGRGGGGRGRGGVMKERNTPQQLLRQSFLMIQPTWIGS